VNASILILAATAFYKNGLFQVAEIQDAHRLLTDIFGNLAPTLFAIALICAGQSSTITGTLAGQIVMEGYLNLRIRPWLRRLITRLIAVTPAFFTIIYFGEEKLGSLLILSQVVLSLQLGFAIIPLIHFTSDKNQMKDFVIKNWLRILAWISAIVIISLNIKLVFENLVSWIQTAENTWYIYGLVLPIVAFFAFLLMYIIFQPWISRKLHPIILPHSGFDAFEIKIPKQAEKILVPIDFSKFDRVALNQALQVGGANANYVLVHVVETVAARYSGTQSDDHETRSDKEELNLYEQELRRNNYKCTSIIGYGNPAKALADIAKTEQVDLIVMAAHGHRGLKDLLLGSTLDSLRHKVEIPVLIARANTN
jgi:manganese transport protein